LQETNVIVNNAQIPGKSMISYGIVRPFWELVQPQMATPVN
jgi:hypothetical protein